MAFFLCLLSLIRLRFTGEGLLPESMALLGSVSRSQLFKLTQSKLGVKARQAEAALRIKRVIADVSQRYRVLNDPRVASKKDSDTPDPSAEKRPLNRYASGFQVHF